MYLVQLGKHNTFHHRLHQPTCTINSVGQISKPHPSITGAYSEGVGDKVMQNKIYVQI